MNSGKPRRGWGLIVLGVLFLSFALITNAARNPYGSLGKSGFGEWVQRKGPVPTKPSGSTDNGSQAFLYSIIAGGLAIAGGIGLMIRGNNGGWDL